MVEDQTSCEVNLWAIVEKSGVSPDFFVENRFAVLLNNHDLGRDCHLANAMLGLASAVAVCMG